MTLSAHSLEVGYKHQTLLGPVDLSVPMGRFVCLIGANGAGKSTLIRTLCGMQSAIAGDIQLAGKSLATLSSQERARCLSVVLTERVAATLMSGYELASLGRYPHLGWGGRLGEQDHHIVEAALKQAGADGLAHRLVTELSDGERQKIMIARALAQQPQLLVLDEATAFLDLPRRIEIMQLLQDLAHQQSLSVLLTTHDLELALRYADTLWLIDGERQIHVGAPEDLAISGALSQTFAAEGLAFDLERGELSVGRGGQYPVELTGTGIPAVWAKRALQRVGCVIETAATTRVHADESGYQLYMPEAQTVNCASLEDLVASVQTTVLAKQAELPG